MEVPLDGQGPHLPSFDGTSPIVGRQREDGSVIVASIPDSWSDDNWDDRN